MCQAKTAPSPQPNSTILLPDQKYFILTREYVVYPTPWGIIRSVAARSVPRVMRGSALHTPATDTPKHHLVHFEYPLPDTLPRAAPDMKELSACRMLALSIVKQAWDDVRGRNPDMKRMAQRYLGTTFWEANHLWRLLIVDLVCEERWRERLQEGVERDGTILGT